MLVCLSLGVAVRVSVGVAVPVASMLSVGWCTTGAHRVCEAAMAISFT